MEKQNKKQENESIISCADPTCPTHGELRVRGRTFKGTVIRKFPMRIVIEFERTIYNPKYERYSKKKTKIHARLPSCMEKEVQVGDYVEVGECRPISKIIHSVFIRKVSKEKNKK